ncbi:dipeptidase [Aurantiacibacter gilvus]|uniref:Dipeptidase n=1 Tax=Aurantiacibacter gilvus TaxID=3139141 RepID=A0ABU9IH16_9SPHN
MRRWGLRIGLLVLLAVGALLLFAPGIVERQHNVIDGQPLPEVSAEAQALHDTLTVVDLHGDTLLWQRDMLDAADRGHIDLPRLQAGNVALQVFSSVTKTPRDMNYDHNSDETDNITLLVMVQAQPVRTWTSLLQRTLYHGEKLEQAAEDSGNGLWLVRDTTELAELEEAIACGTCTPIGRSRYATPAAGKPVGAMLSVEGLHDLEGDIDNLDVLYDAGVRMAGITHFFDNELAGSAHGIEKGGLTNMGREAVQRMERMGMIIDIAHCSHQCVAEVLAMARRPVVSSHGGVQTTCPGVRNLTDDELRGVAATGGVIGIGYWPDAACGTAPADIVRAMRHVRDLVGVDYVALGSDFDGSVTTRFDTSQLVQITNALLEDGWSEDEIRAVMGLNALRVLRAGLEPMA